MRVVTTIRAKRRVDANPSVPRLASFIGTATVVAAGQAMSAGPASLPRDESQLTRRGAVADSRHSPLADELSCRSGDQAEHDGEHLAWVDRHVERRVGAGLVAVSHVGEPGALDDDRQATGRDRGRADLGGAARGQRPRVQCRYGRCRDPLPDGPEPGGVHVAGDRAGLGWPQLRGRRDPRRPVGAAGEHRRPSGGRVLPGLGLVRRGGRRHRARLGDPPAHGPGDPLRARPDRLVRVARVQRPSPEPRGRAGADGWGPAGAARSGSPSSATSRMVPTSSRWP